MIKSSIKLFILYRIWLIDWSIEWLIDWLDNILRNIGNISAIQLQCKGFEHVAKEIYISINIQKLYLICYKSKTKNKLPLFRIVSLYLMIKAIAAFYSKMGYCTLVNGTVSDTSMQYRSSIVIKNNKKRFEL